MSQFIEMFENVSMSSEMQDCFSLIRNGANIKQGQLEGGIPITRIETISEEIIDRQKMGYAGIADNKYELYYLQDGDILMSHINSLKHIGKCALYNKKGNETIIHGMNLLCLRPQIAIINPVFAIHMLRSDIVRKDIADITKPAVNQASFSVKDFGKLKAIIPPMSEQLKFVAIVEQADKSKFGDFKSQFIEMFGGYKAVTPWSEVVTITNGKVYPEEYKDFGTYPICGSGGIMYYGEKKLCGANSVILGRKGNINSPIFMESDYWIVDTAFSLDVDKDRLHPKFFYFWCCQYDFTKLNKQGVLPSLTRKDLEKVEMAIPPLDEQYKFVSIAEQADKSKSVIQKALVYLNDIQSDELREIA